MHSALIEDPDVRQAVDDFRTMAADMRRRVAEMLQLPSSDRQRVAAQEHVEEVISRIAVRAERIGLTADQLMGFITDDMDARARRGRPAPERDTARTVMKRFTDAIAAEAQSHRDLTAAQQRVRDATNARVLAEADAKQLSAIMDAPWWRSWQ